MRPGDSVGKKETIQSIKARIQTLVDGHFSGGEDRIYLSRLGIELGPDRRTLERLTGKKLSQFLGDNFPWKIHGLGGKDGVVYLTPSDQSVPEPVVQVVLPTDTTAEDVDSPSAILPQYKRRIWAAFTKPLEPEQPKRFINLGTLYFGPDEAQVRRHEHDDVREIQTDYIPKPGAPCDLFTIATNLTHWLDAQGLMVGDFVITPRSTPPLGKRSLLDELLRTLSSEQLRRTSLPLDVTQTLLNSKI